MMLRFAHDVIASEGSGCCPDLHEKVEYFWITDCQGDGGGVVATIAKSTFKAVSFIQSNGRPGKRKTWQEDTVFRNRGSMKDNVTHYCYVIYLRLTE